MHRRVTPKGETLPRRAYRVPEVQEMLGIGRSSIYEMLKAGTLKGVKLGGGIRLITADSIEALLSK